MRVVLTLLAWTWASLAHGQAYQWNEKPWEQLSDKEVSDWGQRALQIRSGKWKHWESEHFIIHYFQLGQPIATRCEKFYTEIREFFGNRPDRLGKRKSHVFAFADLADWQEFARGTEFGPTVRGITRGDEFFYLATDANKQFDFKGRVQAHEMTHLIFNRFFTGRPPLWLNEGIAEYFGLRKTLTTLDFRKALGNASRFDIEALFKMTGYPQAEEALHAFYAEAAIVVDFLTSDDAQRKQLPAFVDAMISENDAAKALALFGFKSFSDFREAYDTHRRKFGSSGKKTFGREPK